MDQRGAYKWPRLVFCGDKRMYEVWETEMLGRLHLLGLKDTVLRKPATAEEMVADKQKNADAYAEMIQLLDDESLSLVTRDAPNDGRKALEILREHHAGKRKHRILSLASLQRAKDESVADYVIKAETAITALRGACQTLDDDLLVAMVLKELPESYQPFAIQFANTNENITFADFKAKLRKFEETETEKIWAAESRDSVMTTQGGVGGQRPKTNPLKRKDNTETVYFRCGTEGHVAIECGKKARRSRCASDTHKDKDNRDKPDRAYQVSREDDTDFAFRVQDGGTGIQEKGLIVDTVPTSHIIKDVAEFTGINNTFAPEKHSVESADGTRCTEIAQKRGTAEAGARVDEHVNVLPTEMLVHIFGYLDVVSLCRASQTCWRWNDIIDDSVQLWRRQCLRLRAICPSQVDNDRRDGLSWKLTVMRNYSCSRLKTAWLRGHFSHLTSADQLMGRTMVPLDVETWGDILQAELDR